MTYSCTLVTTGKLYKEIQQYYVVQHVILALRFQDINVSVINKLYAYNGEIIILMVATNLLQSILIYGKTLYYFEDINDNIDHFGASAWTRSQSRFLSV